MTRRTKPFPSAAIEVQVNAHILLPPEIVKRAILTWLKDNMPEGLPPLPADWNLVSVDHVGNDTGEACVVTIDYTTTEPQP